MASYLLSETHGPSYLGKAAPDEAPKGYVLGPPLITLTSGLSERGASPTRVDVPTALISPLIASWPEVPCALPTTTRLQQMQP